MRSSAARVAISLARRRRAVLESLPAQEGAARLLGEAAERRPAAVRSGGQRLRHDRLVLGLGDGALERARGAGAGDERPGVGGLAVEGARVVPAQLGVGGGGARVGRAGEGALERRADVLLGHHGDRAARRGGDRAGDEDDGRCRRQRPRARAMLARQAPRHRDPARS